MLTEKSFVIEKTLKLTPELLAQVVAEVEDIKHELIEQNNAGTIQIWIANIASALSTKNMDYSIILLDNPIMTSENPSDHITITSLSTLATQIWFFTHSKK